MDGESQAARDARVKALWDTLDTRKQGHLDAGALKKGLRKMDHPLKNADGLLQDVLKAIDVDGDGRIQYHEFHSFVQQTEQELWSLFQSIDKDSNGKLDKSELQSAFQRAGLAVPNSKLDRFFEEIDTDHDGVISFEEWRNFLLFIPAHAPGLKAVLSYYSSTVKLSPEGDVQIGDETVQNLGTTLRFLTTSLFGAITQIATPPRHREAYPAFAAEAPPEFSTAPHVSFDTSLLDGEATSPELAPDTDLETQDSLRSVLTACVPKPGYFLAGGLAGVASRTTTAPLDRLKVYLIAQTGSASEVVHAAKQGAAIQVAKHGVRPLIDACKALWRAGGWRSLYAGNGINVIKVMPESAVKFGSYEAAKRVIARLEGHGDAKQITSWSKFVAGGIAGMVSQAVVYPLDTLKFRMQCETVEGGLHGNRLIIQTAKRMWHANGVPAFYRGLPMGLAGMFPYAAIDLGTFEYLKRWLTIRNAKKLGCHEEDALPGSFTTALIGGFSGAFGASVVYPVNLLRTRLQSQGTAVHPRTYTGIMDVTRQTLKGEGVRGLFNGLTPNLLKVAPAVSITYVVYENSKKALHLQ
ncbi:calcium dependent mitochondrial carrier protein-like protein [Cryomyces antarcticus]